MIRIATSEEDILKVMVVRGMVEHLLAEARRQGAKKLTLHAQVYLEDFYASFGFHRQGGIFRECEIDHILMIREDGNE